MEAPFQITVGDIRLGEQEKKNVMKVLDSNRLSYGPFSREFEALFAKQHDSKFAVFCNSGTSALQIALAALKIKAGWQDGDEVIVPSVTFVATSNIVLHNNMTPVFVDVDPHTYNIDPSKIEAAITPRTKAIIPVHLMGLPADMKAIKAIADEYNLKLIEDSCETMFADCHGKKVGSWGEIGCFSTYIAHYVVTGVGGLSTTSDPELAVLMRSLMNHGRDSIYLNIDADNGVGTEKLKEIVARRFQFVHLGHSFRCTEMEAAIGVPQLENKDAIVKARKEVAADYTTGLQELQEHLQLPTAPEGLEHVYMLYPLVEKTGSKRELVNYLEERGIETRDLLPLINQPIYKNVFGKLEERLPVAKWLNESAFYIGSHQYITKEERQYVIDTVKEFYKARK